MVLMPILAMHFIYQNILYVKHINIKFRYA